MSQEESSPTHVLKSPLNKSSSKAQFTFPKANRMVVQKPHNKYIRHQYSDQIYNLPEVANQRATSLGFGKKVNICPPNRYPSPDKYEKESIFKKSPHKGKTMGIGRESFKAISIFPSNKTPGPGQY